MVIFTQQVVVDFLRSWTDTDGGLEEQSELYRQTAAFRAVERQHGRAAAEEMMHKRRVPEFARVVKPIAQGILALAEADTKQRLVKAVDSDDNKSFPANPDIMYRTMIVAHNLAHPQGCDIAGAELFGIDKRLGLLAVTLQTGVSHLYECETGELGIVLRLPRTSATVGMSGFALVMVNCMGATAGYQFFTRRKGVAAFTLDGIQGSRLGGANDIDAAVGVSKARDLLADTLPQLGTYFTASAEHLSCEGG